MRLGMWLAMAAAVAASAISAPASAQASGTQNCKVFTGGVWQELGPLALSDCLQHIDTDVASYGNQGFKFGQWGEVILSADRSYFYRSDDRGGSWRSLGSKAAMSSSRATAVPAAPQPTPTPEPLVTPPPTPQPTLEMSLELTPMPTPEPTAIPSPTPAPTSAAESETEPQLENPYISAPIPPSESFFGDDLTPSPAIEPPTTTTVQPTPLSSAAPTPVATPEVLATPVTNPDYRACSIKIEGSWTLAGATSLSGCARKLRDGPGPFNEHGFKYGYWGQIYLLGTRDGVQIKRSMDADWEALPLAQ
jgi:hypothetical protein